MKKLIVSLHDFHPGSLEDIRKQVAFFQELGVDRFSILVVPDFHHRGRVEENEASLRFLEERRAAGDDLVLHGFYHDRKGQQEGSLFWTRLYSANEAEYFDLSDEACEERLRRGMEIWKKMNWNLDGFIAPGWLMPPEQDRILARLGFSYTTRLKDIVNLREGKSTMTQSLCYSTRSWWRRPVSRAWNHWLYGKLRERDVIRLSMHPHDLNFEAIRLQIAGLVRMTLANGGQPLSYSDYVSR